MHINLDEIKNLATKALNSNIGHYLGRAVVVIQANPVATVVAVIVVAAVIFATYKYYTKPIINLNPPQQPQPKPIPQVEPVQPQPQPQPQPQQPDPNLTESAILRKFQSAGIFESANEDILDDLSNSFLGKSITENELAKSTLEFGLSEKSEELFKGPDKFLFDQVTNLVGDKLHGIYEASQKMNEIFQLIQNDGSRLATATFTFLKGLGSFATGNFISGGLTLGIALKEFYNIKNKGTNVNLENVFKDIKKDFAVINQFGEQAQNALNGIGIEIVNAKIKIEEAEQIFVRIAQIINEGDKELVAYGQDIQKLKKQAIEQNGQAISLFADSQAAAEDAKVLFENCWENIEKLGVADTLNLNAEDALAQVKMFITISEELKTKFTIAMEKFDESQGLLNKALLVSNEAYRLNIQLECKEQFMLQLSKEINEKIKLELAEQELSQANANLDNALDKQLEATELLIKAYDKILDLQENIQKVEEGVNTIYDRNVIAIAFGAATGAAMLGPIGAGFMAIATPKLVAMGQGLYVPKSDFKVNFEAPTGKAEVKLGFYTQSTGLLAFWKEGSNTGGIISIHLGKEVNHYHFNLNKEDNGLEVSIIAQDLAKALDNGDLTIDDCLSILDQLEKPFGKAKNMVLRTHTAFADLNNRLNLVS